MTRLVAKLRGYFMPDVPDAIRDEFVVRGAVQMRHNSRLLFFALFLTTPTAALAAADGASWWVRFAAPMVMALFCLAGVWSLSRDLRLSTSVRRSRRFVRDATVSSSLIAVMCSAWCVYSWLGAPPGERIYYPIIVALGAFSTAYCLSSARTAAVANLVINLVPMLALLYSSGERLDLGVAVSLTVAALFQLHMVHSHFHTVIDLLTLQRQSRELARTDPLTGLLNRRALLDHALELGSEGSVRLLLVDIDHFKTINDGHGHDMGDEVLKIVAERLARIAEIRASVARIGGEEFALVGHADDLPEALALAILAEIRTAQMPHGRQVTVSIGLADGPSADEAGWRHLFNRADSALYTAKGNGRNRLEQASPLPALIAARNAAA
ncbi:MAG: diguanylate cyclase [Novosphingobium sp.]|jgi:diguanylate cyclase (GGDEF)-like protein|uniref:GGDEF domain-containing protein n=1 Tax=Novosphingobium sp. TaxID=1874826 RepID=UPI003919B89E